MHKKCFQCNKVTQTPYHVTELAKGSVYTYDLCKKCGEDMVNMSFKPQTKPDVLDLSHIQTPEQLLQFISGMHYRQKAPEQPDKPPCPGCGLTLPEFDHYGKFGCPQCYDHFTERMEQLVYPYHKADHHVGKKPKGYMEAKWNSSPDEKRKLLKLRMAKAIELEEYEKAAEIKRELQDLDQGPESSSVDQ